MNRAKWIWPDGLGNNNAYAVFQGVFVPRFGNESVTNEDRIHTFVSTSGEYVLRINGVAAGFGQHPGWGQSFCENVPFIIPCFSLAFVVAVWENVLHTRSDAEIDENLSFGPILDAARTIIRMIDKNTDAQGHVLSFKGPRYWNFYEWSEGLEGHIPSPDDPLENEPDCAEGILTAWYALALQSMMHLANLSHSPEEQHAIRRLYARTANALQDFWDEEKGLYAAKLCSGNMSLYAEIMQSLVLLSGACPENRARALREKLTHRRGMVEASLSNFLLRYQALMQEEEKYADFVFDEIGRIWGGMLDKGATTCWETIAGADDFGKAGSLCHGWSAVPAYFYYAYGLGIRPAEPGKCTKHPVYQTTLGQATGNLNFESLLG